MNEWEKLLNGKYDEVYDRAQKLYDAGYINGLRTTYSKADDEAVLRPRPGVAEFMGFVVGVVSSDTKEGENK